MNRIPSLSLIAVVLAMTGASTNAQTDGPKTREQVRAEFEEARRNGELVVNGETGMTLRELYPDRYPQRPAVAAKTREQVKAELAEAQRTGDLYAGGESGLKLNELYPDQYPRDRQTMVVGRSGRAGVESSSRR